MLMQSRKASCGRTVFALASQQKAKDVQRITTVSTSVDPSSEIWDSIRFGDLRCPHPRHDDHLCRSHPIVDEQPDAVKVRDRVPWASNIFGAKRQNLNSCWPKHILNVNGWPLVFCLLISWWMNPTLQIHHVTYLKQLGRMDIRPLPANFCAPVRPVYLPAPAETNTTNIHRVMLLPASQQEYIRTISKTICANSTFTYHCTELVPNAHIRLHDTPYISLHYLRRSWESPKKLTRSQ